MTARNTTQARILIVDDHEDALYAGERMLLHAGFEVFTARDGEESLQSAFSNLPDIILLDIMMPKLDGLEVTRRLKGDASLRYIPILLLSAKDSLQDILDGLEAGADGYITKPFNPDELIARINAALRTRAIYQELRATTQKNERLMSELSERYGLDHIIGESAAMKEVFSLVGKVAPTDSTVLVSGPSGTGKELVARAIHQASLRKEGPFIAKNCAAFSEQLLESQLFGHVKGAFTSAIKDQKGLFEAAHGGTLFLDEVGELPLHLQAKLLRVLQEGMIMPVGTTEERPVDVRIIAATNRTLEDMVAEGAFREDLYFRLHVIHIPLPSLRERKEDIPLLVTHFLDRAFEKKGGARKQVTKEVLAVFMSHKWRGNIRELENELERMCILSGDATEMGLELLSPHLVKNAPDAQSVQVPRIPLADYPSMKEALTALEKEMIRASLEKNKGNKSVAARELGISRSSLISKVQEYNLDSE
jgi:DNA-binding NtrC family response regulator